MRIRDIVVLFLFVATLSSCSTFTKMLKSEDIDAKYAMAKRLYEDKKYQKAITMFDNVQPSLLGTPYEDTISFLLGKALYATKSYEAAGEVMNQYRNKFTRSPLTAEAEYIYSMSFYKLSNAPERDQTETRRAIIAFNEYMNRHPNSPFNREIETLIEELSNKLYYKTFLNAALYYKIGHYNSAVTALRAALKNHPEMPYKEEMMFLICQSWYEYAKNSVYARQLDRYLKMIDAYYNFKTAYPDSKQFGRELERMFEQAEKFTKINGVTAQAIETSASRIEDQRKKIDECKEKLFTVKSSADRKKLHATIVDARTQIKAERVILKREKKTIKHNEKGTN